MVNNVSGVAFKVNNEVYRFILNNNEKYNFYSSSDYVQPLELITNKLTKKEFNELQAFHSNRRVEQNILTIVDVYKDKSAFYIPVRIDNRGRLYCHSDYFNYQSIGLAKGLLLQLFLIKKNRCITYFYHR